MPRHLSLLALEAVLLVEAHLRLLAVKSDFVAALSYSDILKHTDQSHTQVLPTIRAINSDIFYVPTLILFIIKKYKGLLFL